MVPPTSSAYRHTWFQSQDTVEINVMARSRRHDQVSVDFGPETTTVRIDDDATGAAVLTFDLWAAIDPAKSTHEVLSSKIEVRLAKAQPGVQWPSLVKEEAGGADAGRPTQTKKQEKNWDKIDVDDDDEQGKDAMGFFQSLFAGADDDTRRAMMKSYVESNGTSLSTNWDEVKARDFSKEDIPK
jgi:suppressor of G2 allele of SKP1